ncbi:Multiple epidermal growth factor-like domains protein 8 [Linnemannia schmuckeri]|uniref:Multiple epidermal growth factor-like domains protein 8 n=1 Tax=Linnemannia schmuckeri TaxID=64567 RepID=A0A9P5RUH3_9FUNG|nr:Multiple epidermal growth factor-like domains protein 8 [Linnemannia schmuckeri]
MQHRDALIHHSAMLYAIVALFTFLGLVTAGPFPVHSMAYTTVDEKTLYIQGGDPGPAGGIFSNQFYALNLTQTNWNISSPPWIILGTGAGSGSAPTSANHFMTVVDDGQSLMVWCSSERNKAAINSSRITKYKISSLTWLEQQDSGGTSAAFPGFAKSGATDPETNLVYIPAVYEKDTGMTVYNITETAMSNKITLTSTVASMPPPLEIGRVLSGHSTVWSDYRKSLLVYGGRYEVPPTSLDLPTQQSAILSDRFVEYNVAQRGWINVPTKGTSPGKLARHCMVPAEGGRKMIVFGGSTGLDTSIVPRGDIYILDVPSLTWSQGTPTNTSDFRAAMACSIAGDNFIAWGGVNATDTLSSMIIYNLSSKRWTESYSPGASSSGTSSDISHMGGIIGGIVGAVVVVGVIIGYVIYKRRKRLSLQDQVVRKDYEPQEQDSRKHGYDFDTIKRDPHEPVDPLNLKGIPRNPVSIPLDMELQFPPVHQARNPEYAPIVHFQGFQRTDPQYSDTPLQEPWRNPQGMAIPEHIIEDEKLRQQWIFQQQQAALLQQQQQLYLSELDRLRREYERLQMSTPTTPNTPRSRP